MNAPTPVPGAAPTPFRIAEARYRAATAHFTSLPRDLERTDPARYAREREAFLAAVGAVDRTPAANWDEFADAFDIACDGGDSLPKDILVFKLLADCRRLSGRAVA
jgi:hypothetical protein